MIEIQERVYVFFLIFAKGTPVLALFLYYIFLYYKNKKSKINYLKKNSFIN